MAVFAELQVIQVIQVIPIYKKLEKILLNEANILELID